MSNCLRIVIAEDHAAVREGFAMIVNAQPDMEVVGEAGDGREAISLAKELAPDIVLMDISMPTLNGLKAAATLKRIAPDIKILTLTRHTDDAYMQELFQAGVSGYVLKQSAASQLTQAIRTVAKGESFLDPGVAGKVFNAYGEKSRLRGERTKSLTSREEAVLHDIALGYSNREIAEKLDISIKTVESYKASSMEKLDLSSRRDIVRYAILRGWMNEQ
ncbi:MAG: response regulator transcription factor [Acidobacteria bacterium]|nr:response regulator transcription factor [Acidobacteriota bacterium]